MVGAEARVERPVGVVARDRESDSRQVVESRTVVFPTATIFPSGWIARAYAESSWFRPNVVTTSPPMPKVGSRLPLVL